jgi:hypothetical protein
MGVVTATVAWKLMPAQSQCFTGTGIGAGVDGPACFATWFGFGVGVVVPVAVVVSLLAGLLMRVRYWPLVGSVGTVTTAVVAWFSPAVDGWDRLVAFAAVLFAVVALLGFLISKAAGSSAAVAH